MPAIEMETHSEKYKIKVKLVQRLNGNEGTR